MDRPLFYEAINSLLSPFELSIISGTHLGASIFNILSKNEVKINESDFVDGLKSILTSDDLKASLSFKVYKKAEDSTDIITFSQINDFFFSNWCSAFQILGKSVTLNKSSIITSTISRK